MHELDQIVEFIENDLKKKRRGVKWKFWFYKINEYYFDDYNNYPNISHFEIISSYENLLKNPNYQNTYEKSIIFKY